MKRTYKILTIVILTMALIMISVSTLAIDPNTINPNTSNTQDVQSLGEKVIGIIQVVGTIVAIAIIIVLGIKYMLGSSEEKAEYKKTMIPYIVGAVFIFGASTLVKYIYNWVG